MSTKVAPKKFLLRIPPKLRAKLDAYCVESEKTLTDAILDSLRQTLGEE